MQRLLYISTARSIPQQADIDHILTTSRRNNAAAGVSGLLVVGGRRFLQVLEGPPQAVETIFKRIQGDARHFAVVMLANTVITERAFASWAMGYHRGGDATGNGWDAIAALIAPIADPSLRGYFAGFTDTHARAA